MTISDVRILKMKFERSAWLLLVIHTDSGIIGWGDMSDSCQDDVVATIMEAQKNTLIGMDPLCIRDCDRVFSKWRYPITNNVRPFAIARSALNQALWDITAKHYKAPLYKLYGACGNASIPLYGNLNNAIRGNRRTPEDLYKQGLDAKKAGFQIVKCTPFDEVVPSNPTCSLEQGFERIKALTEVYPIERIAIDCHQRFERYNLGAMVERLLTEFGNPFWVEDPVPVLDYHTIEIMNARYPQIRWVAGEDSFEPVDLMRTVASNCYDIVMPDVKYIGGPSVLKGMIQAVEGMGKKISMHNPSGIIATAHSAHLSALCAGLPLEIPVNAVPNRELLTTPMEPVHNGVYELSNEPGIGFTFSDAAIKEYAYEWIGSSWTKMQEAL